MRPRSAILQLSICSLAFTVWNSAVNCKAQSSSPESQAATTENSSANTNPIPLPRKALIPAPVDPTDPNANDTDNTLGRTFLKHLVSDQVSIWTSPARLRLADGAWLFPLAAATGGFLASDRAVPPALSTDPKKLNRYVSISNYGLYSLVAAGGGFYVWGKMTHDDHRRETGILAGEAAIDAAAVDTALKYAFGRSRPYQDNGLGHFFEGGASFPSDHSTVAWSIASVIAHEYPGPLTQIGVYGLATMVSASRVVGKQHFPSDVLIGGAIGWLIGRQVYRAHHDAELGGAAAGPLADMENEERRDRQHMGSTFVPLDSWVYPAFERLNSLGYISSALMGIKPWTRLECARLTEEAAEQLQGGLPADEEAAKLQASLEQEFSREIGLLNGGRNLSANVESLYARAVSISGPALTDGYHFGQTIGYDFGRPFERGTNGQAGGSFSADAGPMAIYVRAEYQHAPGAPALSPAVINFISQADGGIKIAGEQPIPLSQIDAGPFNAVNRVQLLDAYVTTNLGNWQLALGKQSLSWGPSSDSLMWNNNVDPVNMARLVNPEPFFLPGFFHALGPVQIDLFFGRLAGHPYVARPFVYGQKINLKPFSFLELGFGRRTTLAGNGSPNPLTARNFLDSLIGRNSGGPNGSVPGDTESEMDWNFIVPGLRNYVVLYGDAYAEDDILPVENPARNPWHPGLYITRIPGLPKLDFHIEGVSTEQPGIVPAAGGGNHGNYNYWNQNYRDGNTNYGYIIGNTVGREGRAIQSWLTYWISPKDTLQLSYKHSSVSADFVPGGGAWQDYGVRNDLELASGLYIKTQVQFEHISRYPLLWNGPQNDVTAILEIGFHPANRRERQPGPVN